VTDIPQVGLISVGSCGAVLCCAGSEKLLSAFTIRIFLHGKIPVAVGIDICQTVVWSVVLVVK